MLDGLEEVTRSKQNH